MRGTVLAAALALIASNAAGETSVAKNEALVAIGESPQDTVYKLKEENISLREKLSESRTEQVLFQAKSDLQDSSYSRLEIVVGLFGLLLTILVLAFGFRTEKAAARAARAEISDQRRELERIITEARKAATAAQLALETAEAASSKAGDHAKAAAAQAAEAADQLNSIRQAAEKIVASPQEDSTIYSSERSKKSRSREILNQVLRMYDEKEWDNVIKYGESIDYTAELDDEAYALSLYFVAAAYGRVGDNVKKIDILSRLIRDFSESTNIEVLRAVSSALVSRGVAYCLVDDPVNENIDYDKVINDFSGNSDEEIRRQVGRAFYYKAIDSSHAGKIRKTIDLLEKYKEYTGSFECNEVKEDISKAVQSSVSFKNFMKTMGCT